MPSQPQQLVRINNIDDDGDRQMSSHPAPKTSSTMPHSFHPKDEEVTQTSTKNVTKTATGSRICTEDLKVSTTSKIESATNSVVNEDYFKHCDSKRESITNSTTALDKAELQSDSFYKTGISQALKDSESSHIYGEANGGAISFVGSWALQNCSDLAGMSSKPGLSNKEQNGLREGEQERSSFLSYFVGNGSTASTAGNNGEGSNTRQPWRFEAGTIFEIRVSHLLKLFSIWAVAMIVATILFHTRIRSLETERNALNSEVTMMRTQLNDLNERMDVLMEKHSRKSSFEFGANDAEELETDEEDNSDKRVKRSAGSSMPGRGRKDLQYLSGRDSYNSLNNGTTTFDSINHWSTASSLSPETENSKKGARAAYLQIDANSVTIERPRQVIGPWYLPEEGNQIDFNDMWYDNLSLDSNGTSIVFQEDGLFLIYAQVFYRMQPIHNVTPNPMGYRIHLRKHSASSGRRSRKPITIAECVPSFPSTLYQTCFTQVAWFVKAQEEIYLEHFTESKPMIEALRMGQSFLGIVQLS